MPYIKQEDRFKTKPETPGELNFFLTRLINEYLGSNPNYTRFNEVLGALEACKLEYYRRLVVPYENQKCYENGEVYYSAAAAKTRDEAAPYADDIVTAAICASI